MKANSAWINAKAIHLEKNVRMPVQKCFSAFSTTRALNRWYDPEAVLSEFKVNGEVKADYFPGYVIVALIKNQLIAQNYTTVIDGIGLWSFVSRGKTTRIIFDHVADGNQGDEMLARAFHWEGLLENLAAVSERRSPPFVKGQYSARGLPSGIRHATCAEYVKERRGAQAGKAASQSS